MTNLEEWPARRLRHEVELDADVHYPDGHCSKAKVSNLSLDGCRLSGWFRIGDYLELTIPRIGRVRGQVRWAVGGQAGVRFERAAKPDDGAA
ncbi:hypothetical protein GGQ97_001082 [Sphingomonas kaistensis]|uniref:PilZ domain-containing protein n=1 Tax=Sphingomonas kaistensis TaxID=298708 RepID=A0A7X6BFD5_9SPHN|nr:PilZ domain-containing protein [Sphingomonas kaistensis]NJC05289.1 hypothetical protein [Sphingomonas kaistensis]